MRARSCPPQQAQPTAKPLMPQHFSSSPPPVHTPHASKQLALLHQLMDRQRRVLRQQRQEQDEWAAAAQALLRQPGSPKRKRGTAEQGQPVQGASPGQGQQQPCKAGGGPMLACGHGEVSECISEVQRRAAVLDQQRLCHLAVAAATALVVRGVLPVDQPRQAQHGALAAQPQPRELAAPAVAGPLLGCGASKPPPTIQQEEPASNLVAAAASLLSNAAALRPCAAPRPATPTSHGGRACSKLKKRGSNGAGPAPCWPPALPALAPSAAARQQQWATLFSFFRSQLEVSTR